MEADSRGPRKQPGLRCGKVCQPDRLTAEAVRISLEIWYKATRADQRDVRLVVFRCKKCSQLHVGRRRLRRDRKGVSIRPQTIEVRHRQPMYASARDSDHAEKDCDIRYLIEEFDLG